MKETERWKVRWREKMNRRQRGGREGRRHRGDRTRNRGKAGLLNLSTSDIREPDHSVVRAVLCVVGRGTAALGSTHQVPVASPSPNRFETSPDVPGVRGKVTPAPRTSDLEGHRNRDRDPRRELEGGEERTHYETVPEKEG